jgi:hypothetical protein
MGIVIALAIGSGRPIPVVAPRNMVGIASNNDSSGSSSNSLVMKFG